MCTSGLLQQFVAAWNKTRLFLFSGWCQAKQLGAQLQRDSFNLLHEKICPDLVHRNPKSKLQEAVHEKGDVGLEFCVV